MKSVVHSTVKQGLPVYLYSRNSNDPVFHSNYCEILSKVKKEAKNDIMLDLKQNQIV
jgi:hypothetical protein